jgi:hypothetical protein
MPGWLLTINMTLCFDARSGRARHIERQLVLTAAYLNLIGGQAIPNEEQQD